jgi:nucleotide-binding universal stress UspA family protein
MAANSNDPVGPLQTIVVGTDFSETAGVALERACELAALHGARVVIVHALTDALIPFAAPSPVMLPPDVRARVRTISREKLDVMTNAVRELGLDADSLLMIGPPGPEVIQASGEVKADLVVLGTRGLSGFKHLLLGSTAEYVVRKSVCPVLTIHPGNRNSLSRIRTVIIPTQLEEDPTPAADTIIRLLCQKAESAHLILVYSDHLPAYLSPFVSDLGMAHIGFAEIEPELRERLKPLADKLVGRGFTVETVVTEGDPATVITELADDRSADLVAMHTHGRTGLPHLILRSVAERVVQHASCPVVTLKLEADLSSA